VVDGNDVLAVYHAAKQAVAKARAGDGPTIIECKTYRWYDHYGAGGAKIGMDGAFGLGYRSDQELREWMAKDPVARFRSRLVAQNVLSEQRADEIVAQAARPSRMPLSSQKPSRCPMPRTVCETSSRRASSLAHKLKEAQHVEEHELCDPGSHPRGDAT